MSAGAGQTIEGLVQNRNDPLLFFYVARNPITFAMDVVSVEGRYTRTRREATKIDIMQ